MKFIITKLSKEGIILGISWLKGVELYFDWKKECLIWPKEPDQTPLEEKDPLPFEGEYDVKIADAIYQALYSRDVIKVADTKIGIFNIFRVNVRLRWAAPKEGIGIDPLDIGEDLLKNVLLEFRKYVKLFRKEEEVGLPLRSR